VLRALQVKRVLRVLLVERALQVQRVLLVPRSSSGHQTSPASRRAGM
jgi:hypothetical protein